MFKPINLLKLFSDFAKLLIITSRANFLLLRNIFDIFCWIPIGILSCVVPLALIHNLIALFLLLSWNLNVYECSLSVGLCVSSLDYQRLKDKIIVFLLPSCHSLPLHFVPIELGEHLVGSHYYYCVLLKGFWAYLGQMREHGLFSALCELIVVLAPLVLGISLQKKQVEHDLYFILLFWSTDS